MTKSPDPEKLIRQLGQIAHEGYTVDQAWRGERWEHVRLKAAPAQCTGCEICEVTCVAAHGDGAFSTHLARLRIDPMALGKHRVMFCTLCKKCIDVCPTGALKWHDTTGAVELRVDRCTACDLCVQICPIRVILKSDMPTPSLPWYPIICDLCGGDPACTKSCPTGAIFLDERKVVR